MHTHRVTFLQSLSRCTADSGFIAAFYERFLNASEEIRQKFRFTDFEKQHDMLLGSLRLSAGATNGDSESLQELRQRAETHDRYHLDIDPKLYTFWLEAIIQTAQQYDDQWSEEVEEAWRAILGFVIARMTKYY